jgi:hypothetical protein
LYGKKVEVALAEKIEPRFFEIVEINRVVGDSGRIQLVAADRDHGFPREILVV